MDRDERLARELAKIGAVGGSIGGSIGAGLFGSITSAAGGAAGAAFAAHFLPTETYTRDHVMQSPASAALPIVTTVLSSLGQFQDNADESAPNPTVTAIIGSGFFNMNPCLVTVEITAHDAHQTCLVIAGAAKEGLIKQRTAEKAVVRVIEALKSASTSTS
jgi:hypothetical protein